MNRTLIVLCAFLLVLATAGGATAGSLITSKQIKNGTIKAADLHKSLRKTATAPTGFTKVIRVTSTPEDPSWARCPAGTTVIGGGAVSVTNSPIVASYPLENAWFAKTNALNDQTRTWAICAS